MFVFDTSMTPQGIIPFKLLTPFGSFHHYIEQNKIRFYVAFLYTDLVKYHILQVNVCSNFYHTNTP